MPFILLQQHNPLFSFSQICNKGKEKNKTLKLPAITRGQGGSQTRNLELVLLYMLIITMVKERTIVFILSIFNSAFKNMISRTLKRQIFQLYKNA